MLCPQHINRASSPESMPNTSVPSRLLIARKANKLSFRTRRNSPDLVRHSDPAYKVSLRLHRIPACNKLKALPSRFSKGTPNSGCLLVFAFARGRLPNSKGCAFGECIRDSFRTQLVARVYRVPLLGGWGRQFLLISQPFKFYLCLLQSVVRTMTSSLPSAPRPLPGPTKRRKAATSDDTSTT